MQFELSKEFLETIELAIQNSNLEWLKDHVLSLHDADIVSILDELAFEPASFLYHLLGEEIQGDVLMELDEDLRETLIKSFSNKEIAEQVEQLDSDDAADLMNELYTPKGGVISMM